MKRLLILPAVAAVCTVEVWRRGYVAPLMYGAATWAAAWHWTWLLRQVKPTTEADPIG